MDSCDSWGQSLNTEYAMEETDAYHLFRFHRRNAVRIFVRP